MKPHLKTRFLRFSGLFSILALSIWGISFKQISDDPIHEKQAIFLFKDNDGLYSYDLMRREEKLICKIPDSLVFLDEYYRISGDTLLVGTAGFKRDSNQVETYTKYYYAVFPKTKKSYLSSKTSYTVHDRMLSIQQFRYSPEGTESLISEKSEPWKSTSGNIHHRTYNEESKPRFYSSSTLGDKRVFSYRGSIYLVENRDTTLLVENKDDFNPKTGPGNFNPQIHPNQEYVLFTHSPDLFSGTEPSLQLVNLKTHKVHIVKSGDFDHPVFSEDGKFILFSRYSGKEGVKSYSELQDIFILDMANWKETKIGEASLAAWGN